MNHNRHAEVPNLIYEVVFYIQYFMLIQYIVISNS